MLVYIFDVVVLCCILVRHFFFIDGKLETPVLKTEEPLCVFFYGSNTVCSVNIDDKTIYSDAVQRGSITVYAIGNVCKLCLLNFHLEDLTNLRPIQVDALFIRIANTSLQDIVQKGLIVYKTFINKDRKVDLTFSKVGQQTNCVYEKKTKTKVIDWTTQLTYSHNKSVTVTHTEIVYDQCISFYVNCTVGKRTYSLDTTQCPLENKGNGRNQPLILGVSIPVFLLLVVISVGFFCCLRKKTKEERPTTIMMTAPKMMH